MTAEYELVVTNGRPSTGRGVFGSLIAQLEFYGLYDRAAQPLARAAVSAGVSQRAAHAMW